MSGLGQKQTSQSDQCLLYPRLASKTSVTYPFSAIFLCLHEALGLGVVVGIAAPPHGTDEAVVGEDIAVDLGSVLRPAIRVMNAALRRLPYAQSRLQRRN